MNLAAGSSGDTTRFASGDFLCCVKVINTLRKDAYPKIDDIVLAFINYRPTDRIGADVSPSVHQHKGCLVNQREVHADTLGFADVLRAALREDPDIVLIGEMRDLETIESALRIAETGH